MLIYLRDIHNHIYNILYIYSYLLIYANKCILYIGYLTLIIIN